MGEVKFDTIPENSLGSVRFTTGRIPRLAVYPIKYTVYLDSGARYDFSQKVDFTAARFAKTKPKIDAVLENGEWDTATYLYSDSLEQVYLSAGYVWNGVNDLSAKKQLFRMTKIICICILTLPTTYTRQTTKTQRFGKKRLGAVRHNVCTKRARRVCGRNVYRNFVFRHSPTVR
ncbi:MAG: hypothetical protein L6V93_17690 [Clostridiales bacterium]|nr:MAG: hypothetical protein L6V93_17690 [Clostridiales bacterium]